MKREFCMLAHTYKPKKHNLAQRCLSEKLDGMRAIWLPFTRGILKSEVPFANNDKDERLLDEQVSTGLWTRLGNIIQAPDYWLDQLPPFNLDGELYSTTLIRQDLMSTVKKLPKNRVDKDWEEVQLFAFDSPQFRTILADGEITGVNFNKVLKGCVDWAIRQGARFTDLPSPAFLSVQKNLAKKLPEFPRTVYVEQIELPRDEEQARSIALEMLDRVTDAGGEGLMARSRFSNYECGRSHSLVKLKKLDDDDGIVIGYITGRKTDKGSKLLGKMGALILQLNNGKRLELSGFTDEERELGVLPKNDPMQHDAEEWASENPEQEVPHWIEAPEFPRGSRVSFRYRGKSRDGIPNEARYWRKRVDD